MELDQCKPGSFYAIRHSSKGELYARYVGPWSRPGYYEFDILTWPGNGHERFANAMVVVGGRKSTPVWSRKALIASKVIAVSTPSSPVQKEWQDRAASAEQEFERLAMHPVDMPPPAVPPPSFTENEPVAPRAGLFKRIFGGAR